MNRHTEALQRAVPSLGLAGPLSAAMFAVSLFGFAWMRSDGYTHGTKAVSELGAVGAPSALAFNLLGFILPGLLVVVLAIALKLQASTRLGLAGPGLLSLSGLAMVMAGVFPLDPAEEASASSQLHYTGAMLSGVFWALSLFWIGPAWRDRPGFHILGRVTPWFLIFPFLNVFWQIAYQSGIGVLPGWGQRIAFLGYFVWLSWSGMALWVQSGSQAHTDRAKPRVAGSVE